MTLASWVREEAPEGGTGARITVPVVRLGCESQEDPGALVGGGSAGLWVSVPQTRWFLDRRRAGSDRGEHDLGSRFPVQRNEERVKWCVEGAGLLTEGNTLLVIDKASRDERRKIQTEGAQRLIGSGMLDDLFAKIDAGEVQLDGDGGFIQQLIKTGLERGLQAELTEHVGYEMGDPEAALHGNSRNGSFPKTAGTTPGAAALRIPRARNGTFTPRLVPTGSRRPSPLGEMIVSLYAGGMTVRGIQNHPASTIGGGISH